MKDTPRCRGLTDGFRDKLRARDLGALRGERRGAQSDSTF